MQIERKTMKIKREDIDNMSHISVIAAIALPENLEEAARSIPDEVIKQGMVMEHCLYVLKYKSCSCFHKAHSFYLPCRGSMIRIVVPLGELETIPICPPCSSMIAFVSAKPKPHPPI